ncbi:hypothetical protein GCM10019016_079220 [Streptomyces prasinosporus]|uniref:Uncharacterized protein n=2 Tax=Streptomyces TaxID=1883 RepID=A0ABP6TZN8_9ACTN|nr:MULTISPECIES: hypothetical protein [Streptomyces]MCG0062746.1 hypothetical protein [Streptomyces tricolor]GHC13772.1 hypothetical protein GCM10010332_49440 [Streptomyces albogriseolus]
MYAFNPRRARRWFWALLTLAVLAMGALYLGLRAEPSPGTGILVAVSALVLVASTVQAARILTALTGPPRMPHRLRTHRGRRPAGVRRR